MASKNRNTFNTRKFRQSSTYKRELQEQYNNNTSIFGIYPFSNDVAELEFTSYHIEHGIHYTNINEYHCIQPHVYVNQRKRLANVIKNTRLKYMKPAGGVFPPVLCAVNNNIRYEWMKQLASDTLLGELAVSPPRTTGMVGDVLEQLWSYKVPIIRGLWYLRVWYLDKKATEAKRQFKRGRDGDWTDEVCKYMTSVAGVTTVHTPSMSRPSNRKPRPSTPATATTDSHSFKDLQVKWHYISSLVLAQFHDGLLSRQQFQKYIIQCLTEAVGTDDMARVSTLYLPLVVNILPYLCLWYPDATRLATCLCSLVSHLSTNAPSSPTTEALLPAIEECVQSIVAYMMISVTFSRSLQTQLLAFVPPHVISSISNSVYVPSTRHYNVVQLLDEGFSMTNWLDFATESVSDPNVWPEWLEKFRDCLFQSCADRLNDGVLVTALEWVSHNRSCAASFAHFICGVVSVCRNEVVQPILLHFILEHKPSSMAQMKSIAIVFHIFVRRGLFSYAAFARACMKCHLVQRPKPGVLLESDLHLPSGYYLENIAPSRSDNSLQMLNMFGVNGPLEDRLFRLVNFLVINRVHRLAPDFLQSAWSKACSFFEQSPQVANAGITWVPSDVHCFPQLHDRWHSELTVDEVLEHVSFVHATHIMEWLVKRLLTFLEQTTNIDRFAVDQLTCEILHALESRSYLHELLLDTLLVVLRKHSSLHCRVTSVIQRHFFTILSLRRYRVLYKECVSIMRSTKSHQHARRWLEVAEFPEVLRRSLTDSVLNSWLNSTYVHDSVPSLEQWDPSSFRSHLRGINDELLLNNALKTMLTCSLERDVPNACCRLIFSQGVRFAVDASVSSAHMLSAFRRLTFLYHRLLSQSYRIVDQRFRFQSFVGDLVFKLIAQCHKVVSSRADFAKHYEFSQSLPLHSSSVERLLIFVAHLVICAKFHNLINSPQQHSNVASAQMLVWWCTLLCARPCVYECPVLLDGVARCEALRTNWSAQLSDRLSKFVIAESIQVLLSLVKDLSDVITSSENTTWRKLCLWCYYSLLYTPKSAVVDWLLSCMTNQSSYSTSLATFYATKLPTRSARFVHEHVDVVMCGRLNDVRVELPECSLESVTTELQSYNEPQMLPSLMGGMTAWNLKWTWLRLQLFVDVDHRTHMKDAADLIVNSCWPSDTSVPVNADRGTLCAEITKYVSSPVVQCIWSLLRTRLREWSQSVVAELAKASSSRHERDSFVQWLSCVDSGSRDAPTTDSDVGVVVDANLFSQVEGLFDALSRSTSYDDADLDHLLEALSEVVAAHSSYHDLMMVPRIRQRVVDTMCVLVKCTWKFSSRLCMDLSRVKSFVSLLLECIFAQLDDDECNHVLLWHFRAVLAAAEERYKQNDGLKQDTQNFFLTINQQLHKATWVPIGLRLRVAQYIPLRWHGFDDIDSVTLTKDGADVMTKDDSIRTWNLVEAYPNPFCKIVYEKSNVQ